MGSAQWRAGVLTVSDGVAAGQRQDGSGQALVELLTRSGFTIADHVVVADESEDIVVALRRLVAAGSQLIVTTGGTGFGPRDRTPEATRLVIEREAPGMNVLMVSAGLEKTPMAALSRGIVGAVESSLIVNLPGSPKGAVENLTSLLPVIPHALQLLAGDTEHRPISG